ncbi:hypothetical protein D3C79_755730 [compost metagenome]
MRLNCVLQGVVLVDLDLDAATAHMVKQLASQLGFFRRVADVVGQRRTGQVQRTFHRQHHRVERRDRAGRGTHADHQATGFQRIQRTHEGVLANAVEHHIDAHAVGQFANAGGDVFMAVVDRMVATVSPGDFSLLLGRNRADHVQAEQLGPLRNNQANATGGSVQQDSVAFLEVVDAAHQVRGRQAAHGHGGSGLEADGFRQLDQRRGRDQALGAVGAKGV